MLRLKVCGMKYEDNTVAIAAMQPEYLGFIFYKPSKRYCGATLSGAFVRQLPESSIKTGVFVNESISEIDTIIDAYGLKAVQLHGEESPEVCAYFKTTGVQVLKAIPVGDTIDWDRVKAYEGSVDFFLFDTLTKGYGGSGQPFSHRLLESYALSTPYFLSGGIDSSIWSSVSGLTLPGLYGFDINSKFEVEPGRKDEALVQTFNQHRKQFNGLRHYIG